MHTSHQQNEKINNANLAVLKAKLASLEQSFKKNLLTISDDEIESLKSSNINNKITAWNWSKSFTQ